MQHNETANGGHGLPMASQRRIKAALDAGEDLAAFLGIISNLSQDQERIAAILMERWSKRRRKAQIE